MMTSLWVQSVMPTILAVLATCVALAMCYESCPEEVGDVKKCLKQYFNDTDRVVPVSLEQMLAPSGRKRRSVVFNPDHCQSFRLFVKCSDHAVVASSETCESHVEEKLCRVLKSFFLTYENPICQISFQQWRADDGHSACVTKEVGASGQDNLTYPSIITLLALGILLWDSR